MGRIQILDDKCKLGHTVIKCQWQYPEKEQEEVVGVFSGYQQSSNLIVDTDNGRHWPPIGHGNSHVWAVEPEKLAAALSTGEPIKPETIFTQLW